MRRSANSRIPGPVSFIVSLFIASAALRLILSVPQVMAASDSPEKTATVTTESSEGTPKVAQDADLQRILDALRTREAALAAAEHAMQARQTALQQAEEEAARRIAQAETAEAALQDTMALADSASETDLAQLTRVYEQMKPKRSAALFDAMQPQFAAGFLGRMSPNTAAAVMAELPPEKAYSISVILAGRNALAGQAADE